MNYELIRKTILKKNPIQKIENSKKKLPNVKKKHQREIHAATALAFSLHFLFRRDQDHYSNLTSKIIKICEKILRQRPNTIQTL